MAKPRPPAIRSVRVGCSSTASRIEPTKSSKKSLVFSAAASTVALVVSASVSVDDMSGSDLKMMTLVYPESSSNTSRPTCRLLRGLGVAIVSPYLTPPHWMRSFQDSVAVNALLRRPFRYSESRMKPLASGLHLAQNGHCSASRRRLLGEPNRRMAGANVPSEVSPSKCGNSCRSGGDTTARLRRVPQDLVRSLGSIGKRSPLNPPARARWRSRSHREPLVQNWRLLSKSPFTRGVSA